MKATEGILFSSNLSAFGIHSFEQDGSHSYDKLDSNDTKTCKTGPMGKNTSNLEDGSRDTKQSDMQ